MKKVKNKEESIVKSKKGNNHWTKLGKCFKIAKNGWNCKKKWNNEVLLMTRRKL